MSETMEAAKAEAVRLYGPPSQSCVKCSGGSPKFCACQTRCGYVNCGVTDPLFQSRDMTRNELPGYINGVGPVVAAVLVGGIPSVPNTDEYVVVCRVEINTPLAYVWRFVSCEVGQVSNLRSGSWQVTGAGSGDQRMNYATAIASMVTHARQAQLENEKR